MDGHFHTELCPHGSGDRTALMIEKAIELRIEKVCLTEHAPLPKAFEAEYGGDKVAYDTASLKLNQVDSYLELGVNYNVPMVRISIFPLALRWIISLVLKATFKTS